MRVRQALALTVDREAMVGFVAGGYGTPGNDTPMNAAYRFYKDMPLKKPDIAKAKQLLAEAGYPNGIDLTLIASDTPATRTQLGVADARDGASPPASASTCRPCRTRPISTRCGRRALSTSASTTCRRRRTPSSRCSTPRTPPGTRRAGTTAEFDSSSSMARGTTDEAKRAALYGQAQDLMHDAGARRVIPVFFDLLAGAAQLGGGLRPASARRGVPARPGLARRRRAEARLRPEASGVARLARPPPSADRLHDAGGLAGGVRHHAGAAGRCGPALLGENATPAALAAVRAKLGLGDPAWLQYWHWLPATAARRFRHLDAHGQPVGPAMLLRSSRSLLLAACAILLMLVVAVPLGVVAALRRGRPPTSARPRLLSRRLAAGIRHRDAAAALLLADRLQWLPATGYVRSRRFRRRHAPSRAAGADRVADPDRACRRAWCARR